MANLTSVHVTGGIPDAGTGTVSTIDELILVGLPLSGGTVTVSGTVTGVVSGTTFVSGGTVTAQISGGTSFVSGGNVTAVISGTANLNQAGAALSSTNGIFSNILLGNSTISTANPLQVQLVSWTPNQTVIVSSGTAVISGTTFISGGTVTAVVSGTTVVSGTVTAVVSGTTVISSGTVTASLNIGGSALSSTNGDFSNVLYNNNLVTAGNGLPVNIVSGTLTLSSIGNTTFFALQTGTWNDTLIQGGVALSSTNGIYSNLLQQNATLSPTNGLYANVLFGNAQVTAGNGLPVNIVSGTITVGNVTSALNQGGAALSSTNGAYFNVLFNNTLVSASVGLPVNLVTYITLTAVVSGTAFVNGGNITAVVSGTTAINQGGSALSSTNGIFSNLLVNGTAISTSNALAVQLISGTLVLGTVTAQISGGTSFISGGNITAVVSGTVTAVVSGDTASGASDAGNPVKVGGLAKTANPTGVTDGQRVNALHDILGRQIIAGSVRGLKGNIFTTLIATTGQLSLIPAISTAFIDVYGCILENTSSSTCTVTFRDATAATPQFEFTVPGGDTRGFMVAESGAYRQTAQNTSWTIQCNIAVTSIAASLLYVKNITA